MTYTKTPMEAPMELSDEVAAEFRDLVRANLDSHDVLTEIANCMNDSVTAEKLNDIAQRRSANADDLRQWLSLSHDGTKEGGGLGIKLQQIWIDCRAAVNDGDTYVMLIEAEKAEADIQDAYAKAISTLSETSILSRMIQQFSEIRRDSELIAGLRTNLKAVRKGFAQPQDHR